MSTNKESLGDRVYDDAGKFGRVYSIFTAIGATIVFIVMLSIGIIIIRNRYRLKSVNGQVKGNSLCETITTDNNVSTLCTTNVTYKIGDNTYSNIPTQTGSTSYIDGQEILVWYNPTTPNVPELQPTPSWIGYLLIVIGLVICISAWFWVYLARVSNFASAGIGAAGIYSLFKG